ncbi:MAG: EscU/YscU/HrcU family type III secretion system export apparatus switch protein [Planctomycetaceae bacterium]
MSSEKTEQPTAKKLRDARQKGQVAVSRDITSTVTLALAMIYLAVALPSIMQRLGALIVRATNLVALDFQTSSITVIRESIICSAYILLPFLAIIIFGGVFSIYAQIGFLIAPDAIKPDLKRLNPVDKAKQIFSIKNMIEFAKNVVKIAFLSILIYLVLKRMIPELVRAPAAGPASMLTVLGLTMKTLAINIVVGYLIIASADFFFQQWQHRRQLMMT